jgi:hypothetical protein
MAKLDIDEFVFNVNGWSRSLNGVLQKASRIAVQECERALSGPSGLGRILSSTALNIDEMSFRVGLDITRYRTEDAAAQALGKAMAQEILKGAAARLQSDESTSVRARPAPVGPGTLRIRRNTDPITMPGEKEAKEEERKILDQLEKSGDLIAWMEVRLRTLLRWFTSSDANQSIRQEDLKHIRKNLQLARNDLGYYIKLSEQRGIQWKKIPRLDDKKKIDEVCRELAAAVTIAQARADEASRKLKNAAKRLYNDMLVAIQAIAEAKIERKEGLFAPLAREGGAQLFHHGCSLAFATDVVYANAKIKSLGKGEFGKGFYVYENNPERARGTAKKFAWRGRTKRYEKYGVIQFTVADSIFNKYVKKKLSFAHPRHVQDVYDPVTGKFMKMSWEEFVNYNRSWGSRKEGNYKQKEWEYQYIKGPLMPFRWDPSTRQICLQNKGIDMLNDPGVERDLIDQGKV